MSEVKTTVFQKLGELNPNLCTYTAKMDTREACAAPKLPLIIQNNVTGECKGLQDFSGVILCHTRCLTVIAVTHKL